MKRYLRLWIRFVRHGFMHAAQHPLDYWTYLGGKIIREVFFFIFIFSIFRLTPLLAGYNFAAGVLIFVTFSLVDILVQALFFRGLYQLQEYVRRGTFDRFLTYPVSPLFYSAFRQSDMMDFVSLIPVFGLFGWTIFHISSLLTVSAMFLYLILVLNGVLIAFALSVMLASIVFFSDEMENVWWFYRYAMQAGRNPIEVFRHPFRFIFTWVIPLGVMITFPSRALLGILSWQFVLASFALSAIFLYAALNFWKYAIQRYSSASS